MVCRDGFHFGRVAINWLLETKKVKAEKIQSSNVASSLLSVLHSWQNLIAFAWVKDWTDLDLSRFGKVEMSHYFQSKNEIVISE